MSVYFITYAYKLPAEPMPPKKYANYALMALGLALLGIGAGRPSVLPDLSALLRNVLVGAGTLLLLAGGVWHDYRNFSVSSGRDVAAFVGMVAGMILYMSITFDAGLPDAVRTGLGFAGLVVLVVVGWRQNSRRIREYDQRRSFAHHRAAYAAFRATVVLLVALLFGAYVTGAGTLVLGGVALVLGAGGLTYLVAEGYYLGRTSGRGETGPQTR